MMDPHTKLQNARVQINEIDAGILALLDKRLRLSGDISSAKKALGKDIFDPKREEELLNWLKKKNKDTVIPDDKLLEIWGKIIELSRKLQA